MRRRKHYDETIETTKLRLYINNKKRPDSISKELHAKLGKNVTRTIRNALMQKVALLTHQLKIQI